MKILKSIHNLKPKCVLPFLKIKAKIILPISCLFTLNLNALNSFTLHNIDKAHAQGITGKGVNLAIIDGGFQTNHPLLQANILSIMRNSTWSNYPSHGTHVAGIIAATKTNGVSYGIAYNAKFLGYGNIGSGVASADLNKITTNKVKIINNSHNGNYGYLRNYAKSDILVIYASGNDGQFSPHAATRYGTGTASNLGAWLAVGNLNAGAISKNGDKLVVSPNAITSNSGNLCYGAPAYCVMASGTGILSLNTGSGFAYKTGTSMAAPAVSGMAALVAEKFPFLGGKQLADVILSTANKDFDFPKLFIRGKYVIYVDNAAPKDEAAVRADIAQVYGDSVGKGAKLESNLSNVISRTKEDIFGQGIVDVEAALKGLALIDINRLNQDDIKNYGTQAAFYTIDTKGFDGHFQNDISQKKWDANLQDKSIQTQIGAQMQGLDAGLIKAGNGTLSMSGNLNYLGATVVQGGTLYLTKPSALSVAGEVFVEKGAKLSTNTNVNIAKNLTNEESTINVGVGSKNIIDVKGAYTQRRGLLELSVLVDNGENSAIKASSYDILGGTLLYKPLTASIGRRVIYLNLQGLEGSLSKFDEVEVDKSAHAIKYRLLDDKKVLVVESAPNIYADFEGANESLAAVLRNMSQARLSSEYDNFFVRLNASNFKDYRTNLETLDDKSHLLQSEQMLLTQGKNTLDNVLFLQNASQKWLFEPHFSKINSAKFEAYRIGANIIASKPTLFGALSGFLSYDNIASNGVSKTDSNAISLGLGAKSNLGVFQKNDFEVFGGASFGGAYNNIKKDLNEANFNSLFASAWLGVDKNFTLNGASLTPTAFLSYHFLHQGDIKDKNNGLFSRQIYANNSHFLSVNLGANLRQNLQQNFSLNAYGFYERRLLGNAFKSKAKFYDYADKFSQKHLISSDFARLGLNLNYEIKEIYTSFIKQKTRSSKGKKIVKSKKLKNKKISVYNDEFSVKRVDKIKRIYFFTLGFEGEFALQKDAHRGFNLIFRGGANF